MRTNSPLTSLPAPRALASLLPLFSLLSFLLWPTVARADPAVALDPATVTRDRALPAGNPSPSINADDCAQNVHFTFPLSLSGVPADGAHLQAWAGVAGMDCSLAASRTGAAPSCWPLLAADVDTSKSTVVVPVSSRQLVAQLALATKTAFKDAANVDTMCKDASMPTAPAAITVWFLFTDAAGAPLGAPVKYGIMIDVRAPAAPTGVKTGMANGALIVDFTPSKETDTAGYTFYCVPAITSVDAGASDGGTGSCQNGTADGGDAAASPGVVDPANICGHVEGNGASGIADHLANGSTYAVVVAAHDNYGNLGSPSAPACGTPQETADFWESYRDHGGLAGGGFCGVSRVGTPARGGLGALGTAAAMLALLRRRRSALQGSVAIAK